MKKIVAVASFGGHWVQLLRLTKPMNEHCDIVYMTTNHECANMVEGHVLYNLSDFSRWDMWKIVPSFFRALKLLLKEKPDAVLSTGAAPGLVVLLAARIIGIPAVWVDSVANAEELSMCGRIASKIASSTFTQWPHLANVKVKYAGNVLGPDSHLE